MAVTFLPEKKFVMPECVSVEIGMQTQANCMKKKTFTVLALNETAICPKIVILKACILNDLYQQSQSTKI